MSKPEFVYVTYIATTPERLWQALTDPEMTKDYWGRHRNISDWREGADWRHEDYDDASSVQVVGKVIESKPPRRLVLSWSSPADAGDSEKISHVSFDIEEFMGSVKLTVSHRDLGEQALRNVSNGWPAILSSLKSLLETGTSLPMTQRQWGKRG
jgi:uncharacterized protein YndB with AHSA1/START domain